MVTHRSAGQGGGGAEVVPCLSLQTWTNTALRGPGFFLLQREAKGGCCPPAVHGEH